MGDAVRLIGTVEDVHGMRLAVGVDFDTVTIGPAMLDAAQRDEFARLYFEAQRAAEAWAATDGPACRGHKGTVAGGIFHGEPTVDP